MAPLKLTTKLEELRLRRARGVSLRSLAPTMASPTKPSAVTWRTPRKGRNEGACQDARALADITIVAEALGISEAEVVVVCERREFRGAVRIGRTWLIPRSAAPQKKSRRRG